MSPMTRNRVFGLDLAPTDAMVTYYAQRAGAGLIITEGIQPNAVGQGYPNTPGLHTDAQIAGRRKVADAVHAEGGVIYAQLMHTGRIGHPTNYRASHHPVGPSPVKAEGRIFTQEGLQDFVVPRGLDVEEIGRTTGVPPLATGLASPSRSSRPWSRRSATTAPPCASRRRTRSTTSRRRLSRRPTVTWSPG